jgi:hypothetical protein
MAPTTYHRTECQHCNGHIEYPSDIAGQSIQCPHCRQMIVLPPHLAPATPPVSVAAPVRPPPRRTTVQVSSPVMPRSLLVVAIIFMLSGLAHMLYFAHDLFRGVFAPVSGSVRLVIGILNLCSLVGVRRRWCYWHIYALGYIAWSILRVGLDSILEYRHSTATAGAAALTAAALVCGMWAWCAYVMLRSDVRELFHYDRDVSA